MVSTNLLLFDCIQLFIYRGKCCIYYFDLWTHCPHQAVYMPLILKAGYKFPMGVDHQPPGPYLVAVYGDIDYLRLWSDVLLSAIR